MVVPPERRVKPRILMDPNTGELVEVGEEAVSTLEPYEYAQARRVGMKLSRERQEAERTLAERVERYAELEAHYRQRLREQIVKDKAEHGATVALDMARGHPEVVALRQERDVAKGMVEAARERLAALDSDRATFHRLVEWSQQRERMETGVGA